MDIIEKLKNIRKEAEKELKEISKISDLLEFKSKYLNKKTGRITEILKLLPELAVDMKRIVGKEANMLKKDIEAEVKKIEKALSSKKDLVFYDITLPGTYVSKGYKNIILKVLEDCKSIFSNVGFDIVEGPQVETDYYNFEALNIPEDHPARDMHDTFYVSEHILLRTHTSPVQIRVMEKQKPPIAMISPGPCYRSDTPDATHSPVFHQIEGLYVDKNVSFADLKGILTYFFQSFFSKDVKLRFRPSFFPFTEPSTEVDISCIFCGGKGCNVCKHTGWIEVAGAGMVDPEVFKYVDYDTEIYSGYAFGMGVERITMLKYQINDIRLFFENNLNFLNQF